MNTNPLFQFIPNFSEGRRAEVIAALVDSVRNIDDVRLIDYSADVDHNRSVLTLLGGAQGVRTAASVLAAEAVKRIDLRLHTGIHPRTGAIDVVPVVPLNSAVREDAVALAHTIGADIAKSLSLPVYFYEWAALQGRATALPDLRKGGFERFASIPLTGAVAPDVGPDRAHPSAGITLVGARAPLAAYNIDLDTPDPAIANAIARNIRAERDRLPELTGVRALGLYLASRNRAQVSMNLTRPELTSLPAVFAYVNAEAQRYGANAYESEIIGVISATSLGGQSPGTILWRGYRPTQILDNWLP